MGRLARSNGIRRLNPYQDVIDWLESSDGEDWSMGYHSDMIYKSVLIGIKNDGFKDDGLEFDVFLWHV